MALLESIRKKIYSITTTTLSNPTFCEFATAINDRITKLFTTLSAMQSQINEGVDSLKVKVQANDTCPGFLKDKIIESDTITVQEVDNNGCKTLKLNVKPAASTGNGPTPLLISACKTNWTAQTNYEILQGFYITNPGIPNAQLQGDVMWRIDELGKVHLRGAITANGAYFHFDINDKWNKRTAKIFELPDNQCLKDLLDNTSDNYGANLIINGKYPQGSSGGNTGKFSRAKMHTELYRIGRAFYVDFRQLGEFDYMSDIAYYDVKIAFGHLKSIN